MQITLPRILHNVISEIAYSARCDFVNALALAQISFARMAYDQRETKDWLRALAKHFNVSPSQLALNSGVAASTLTRYLNDNTNTVGISQATLEKVSIYTGFRPGQMPGSGNHFPEPDVIMLAHDHEPKPKWLEAAVAGATEGKAGAEAWVVKGAALDGIGILPGDIAIIDRFRRPMSGDIVLARVISDLKRGAVDSILRQYQTPYLISHSMRLGPQRPEQVDDFRVSIIGVLIASFRFQH